MKFLEKTFTLLHIRTHNRKFMKLGVRQLIFIGLFFAGLYYLYQVISCFLITCTYIAEGTLSFMDIQRLVFAGALFFSFTYLTVFWIKVWKVADYMISKAIHGYEEEEEGLP